jgi:co-chaperonin GroES (HSP10)
MSLNKSGIIPVGFSVLIEPDPVEEKTASGIITATPAEADRKQLAQTDGVVLAIGPLAFSDEPSPRCKAGERVVMKAYAGMLRKGTDGNEYRIIADTDVIGVLETK